jgi:hypothetical protein
VQPYQSLAQDVLCQRPPTSAAGHDAGLAAVALPLPRGLRAISRPSLVVRGLVKVARIERIAGRFLVCAPYFKNGHVLACLVSASTSVGVKSSNTGLPASSGCSGTASCTLSASGICSPLRSETITRLMAVMRSLCSCDPPRSVARRIISAIVLELKNPLRSGLVESSSGGERKQHHWRKGLIRRVQKPRETP